MGPETEIFTSGGNAQPRIVVDLIKLNTLMIELISDAVESKELHSKTARLKAIVSLILKYLAEV
jgi:hypothetical protein